MNFDDYINNIPYPNRNAYKAKLIGEINDQRLTSQERTTLVEGVPNRVHEWFKEAVKPYNEEGARLREKFWANCREDVGYDRFLDDVGVLILEDYAWGEGHSGGYHEVHNSLLDLADLACRLVGHGKGK
jgi:hypothetical protein